MIGCWPGILKPILAQVDCGWTCSWRLIIEMNGVGVFESSLCQTPLAPDVIDAILLVQKQQLSSLDAIRQLHAQHKEWQKSIQDVLRLAQPTQDVSRVSDLQAAQVEEAADLLEMVPASEAQARNGADSPKSQRRTSVYGKLFRGSSGATRSVAANMQQHLSFSWWPSHWPPSWFEQLIEQAKQPPTKDGTVWSSLRVWAQGVVSKRSFEYLIGVLIFAHLILQGVETELELRDSWQDSGDQDYTDYTDAFFTIKVVDLLFFVLFSFEIVLRFVGGGLGFFFNAWFLLDTLLILTGLVASVDSLLGGSAVLGKTVRGLRLIRLGRAAKMTRKFQVLWPLINGLLNSAKLMISVFVILALFIYIFACLGVELISMDEDLREGIGKNETKDLIDNHFATLPLTMLTLVQFITLDSVAAIYLPLMRVKPLLAFYVVPILLILPITLMNLVTAVLVEHGLEHAQEEAMELKAMKSKYAKESALQLGSLFQELDHDGNGQITRAELNLVPVPKELFDVLFVDDLSDVFDMLDVDSTGTLSKDEFVDGILQMITRQTPVETLQMVQMLQSLRKTVQTISQRLSSIEADVVDFRLYQL
ncbi:Cacna1b [Symbiodinium microadriaticum]|nr:Cacna1b [Symbiodinium microadriaticum]